ncbi:acyl-CoA thioesterase [Advenella mimigardefordensis]|uniref:Putative thioesterase superfamily protein n=1 Tax=Advenella mimigardefordensis (strain DSM 17166 / LMG 22922 / DPN7) TaxID=1247726 RepID=W0PM60_ADVMD|nr:acyl-CoA thioesterase [Advenella mimigardefordensis]AHG66093.1 putative thioesterase superfamily protein [Advenella mimigardefordensis DPN7]
MTKHPGLSICVPMTVPFFDVDALHIVWHGHYVKYLEIARCALLDKLGYNYDTMRAAGYAWPVVTMQLKYVRPAVFGQKILIDAHIREWESRLRIAYLITDADSGERLTQAETTQVAVLLETREMQFETPQDWQHIIRQVMQSET